MLDLRIGADELPAEPGDTCTKCLEPIAGTKYLVYVQVGEATQANYCGVLCEECWEAD